MIVSSKYLHTEIVLLSYNYLRTKFWLGSLSIYVPIHL